MKTFKLILKSLISNNACIEGGRKKPWYFAAIMFFLAMIFAILPTFVQKLNTNGDDTFKTYTYGLDVAALSFNEFIDKQGIKMYVKTLGEEKVISSEKDGASYNFDYTHQTYVKGSDGVSTLVDDYKFFYRAVGDSVEMDALVEAKISFVYFTQNEVYIRVVNLDTKNAISTISCLKAPKYLNDGRSINDLLSKSTDSTTRLTETFSNWKLFIREAYTYTRLTILWQNCAILGAINVGITLFMGLMIWILTRGKNNPYRMFNLWETQKMAWWCSITPSILALALGFLITSFTQILFPMTIGIRVMWLSMKSLRPDGSGYAESN